MGIHRMVESWPRITREEDEDLSPIPVNGCLECCVVVVAVRWSFAETRGLWHDLEVLGLSSVYSILILEKAYTRTLAQEADQTSRGSSVHLPGEKQRWA